VGSAKRPEYSRFAVVAVSWMAVALTPSGRPAWTFRHGSMLSGSSSTRRRSA